MREPTQSLRLNFSTKILLPVVSLLVLVPVLTLWINNRQNTGQALHDAERTLRFAEASFKKSVEIRAQHLLVLHHNVVNDSRLKVVLSLRDAPTTNHLLNELLRESGDDAEVLLLTSPDDEVLGRARKSASLDVEGFRTASQRTISEALGGQPAVSAVPFGGGIFDVVSVPVFVSEALWGALTIGVRRTEAVVQELKALTRTEILLFSEGKVAASTLDPIYHASLIGHVEAVMGDIGTVAPIILEGEHYLAVGGKFGDSPAGQFGFLILSSYEARLRALKETQRTLVWISLAGICFSTGIVWFLIRRITRPLVDLRDNLEAVGSGDFSRRIRVASNDEFGALGGAVNRMTENLNSSRSELEKTVETLRTTQAQLIQSEKLSAVGQFVAGVAHELNNPLTSVIGFSELLRETQVSETQRTFLNHIHASSERCQRIVKNLLSFSRQHAPERRLLDINELIRGVVDLVSYEFRTGNTTIQFDLSQNLPRISGDPHQLQQVFLNILNNARQAIESFRRDGRIMILTREHDHRARVEFHDNGPGISPENLQRIFDPFFTTKPSGKGTGLGLSVSYGIVEEHGGTIRARSEIGQGAVFNLEFPIPDQNAEGDSRQRSAPSSGSSRPAGNGERVLVIDDEESILNLVAEILKRDNYAVESTSDGKSALNEIERNTFDAILCDWKMPGMNGPAIYETLRKENPAAAARFAFMTGDVINEGFQEFLKLHSVPCLPKPFSIQEFRTVFASIANRK